MHSKTNIWLLIILYQLGYIVTMYVSWWDVLANSLDRLASGGWFWGCFAVTRLNKFVGWYVLLLLEISTITHERPTEEDNFL